MKFVHSLFLWSWLPFKRRSSEYSSEKAESYLSTRSLQDDLERGRAERKGASVANLGARITSEKIISWKLLLQVVGFSYTEELLKRKHFTLNWQAMGISWPLDFTLLTNTCLRSDSLNNLSGHNRNVKLVRGGDRKLPSEKGINV